MNFMGLLLSSAAPVRRVYKESLPRGRSRHHGDEGVVAGGRGVDVRGGDLEPVECVLHGGLRVARCDTTTVGGESDSLMSGMAGAAQNFVRTPTSRPSNVPRPSTPPARLRRLS